MNEDRIRRPTLVGLSIFVLGFTAIDTVWGVSADFNRAWGSRYRGHSRATLARRHRGDAAVDWIKRWNEIAINAAGLDHTVEPGDARVFGEQLGPGRSNRAMAIVHIAIFEAVNAIAGGYESYVKLPSVRGEVSLLAAVATAAHDTLIAVYPSQRPSFDNELAVDFAKIADSQAKSRGLELGRHAASTILEVRDDDGAQDAEPRMGIDFITSSEAGKWRQDPISLVPLALAAQWGEFDGFVLRGGDQFRAPTMRAPTSRSNNWAATALPRRPSALLNKPRLVFIGLTTARRVCARRLDCITRLPSRSPISRIPTTSS